MDDIKELRYRACVQQLYREHAEIAYRYKVTLRPVVLQIVDMSRHFGRWDPQLRAITLSQQLIDGYTWDTVIEILKHEMAHQMVSEYFHGDEAHGSLFAKACAWLSVAPWARQASGELPARLPNWRDGQPDMMQERLLKKVEKLLALATSSNEHEAQSAMQRAQELYTRYNLQHLLSAQRSDMVTLVLCQKRRRIERPEARTVALLVEYFQVDAVYCHTYDAVDMCQYSAVEVMGRRENVLMAEYVYHFLMHQTRTLWQQYKATTGQAMRAKNSYMLGVLHGFGQKLEQGPTVAQEAAAQGLDARTSTALIRRDTLQLRAFVESRHPRLVNRKHGASCHDSTSYQAGQRDGATLTLHKGVHAAPANRGLLLRD